MLPGVIPFPEIDPFVFQIGGFGLRWYALAYIAGLLLAWWMAMRLVARPRLWPDERPPFEPAAAEQFLFLATLGVVIGGRLGFVLFYNWEHYAANPLDILKTWEGGMAFHGGMLGVIVGGLVFVWLRKAPLLSTFDAVCAGVPFGLLFGRLANFINAELWGKPWDGPWAMVFPTDPARLPRHPSQLYEAALEGLVLLIVVQSLAWGGGLKRPGLVTGVFLAGYGAARSVVELYREPNEGLGCVTPLCLQMGQLLSLPMIALGLALIGLALLRPREPA